MLSVVVFLTSRGRRSSLRLVVQLMEKEKTDGEEEHTSRGR
jgi:hypothetical protein